MTRFHQLDITSTPFSDATIITYIIELTTAGKEIGLNLLDNKNFTIPCIIDIIPNSQASHKLSTHYKKIVWIVAINGAYPLTEKGHKINYSAIIITVANPRSRSDYLYK